jgi:hypothetical protein
MRSPTRRGALAAVSVAVLLVTAGCLGVTNPTNSGTPAANNSTNGAGERCSYDGAATPTTATGTWSPNAPIDQYPPGVAANGTLRNGTVLVDAHFDATANQSMALRTEASLHDRVRTLVHGPDRTPLYSTYAETVDRGRVETAFYGFEETGLARISLPNETGYSVYQNTSFTDGLSAWTNYDDFGLLGFHVYPLVEGGNYSVNGTVERGGRTFVELTTGEDSLETGHITNGTVLVTPDGVIHDVDATAVQQTGENETRRIDVSLTVDTDIEWCGPPSWTAEVPQLSVSIVADGRAVEIRNTGGAPLPANTSFKVRASEEPMVYPRLPRRSADNGTVTTSARLEPGEAVYVTASADGSSYTLHEQPTRGEYTFGAAGFVGETEQSYFRLLAGVDSPDWAE